MAANPSIQLGTDGNWAIKENNLLAYKKDGTRFFNKEFDFTRNTTATFVDKNGLIKESATNTPRIDFIDDTTGHLLLEPQSTNLITNYTGAGFATFSGASITANNSTSPDGTTNATLMTTTGSANQLIQQASITISSGQSYTVSGYFKLKSGTLSDPDNAFKGLDGLSGGGITGSTFNSTLTSEWQRLSFTVTSSTTSGRVQIKCEDAAEILVWGLQVELGAYETSIIPTNGSTVTRNQELCNNSGSAQDFNSTEGVLFAEIKWLDESGAYRGISVSDGSSNDNNRIQINFNQNTGNLVLNVTVGGVHQAFYSSTIFPSNFSKVGIKYKENDFAFWVNGIEIYTDNLGITYPANTLSELKFNSPLGTVPFYGNVKSVAVFKRAMSDGELYLLTVTQYQSYQEMATALNYTL